MKDGLAFEKLAKRIFDQLMRNSNAGSVTHDVRLPGKDGDRQIDILIEGEIAGMKMRTIVECKDYKNKITVGKIDALHSLMQDVNANKAAMVSAAGFSSTAIRKASRVGISLYTAHEALTEAWRIDFEIPVLVTEVVPALIPRLKIFFPSGFSGRVNANIINDIDITRRFLGFWSTLDGDSISQLRDTGNIFNCDFLSAPLYVRTNQGNLPVRSFQVSYDLEKKYYFGYLNEQRDCYVLKDIIEKNNSVFFSPDLLWNYKTRLNHVSKDEIPDIELLGLRCLMKPVIDAVHAVRMVAQKVAD